MGLYLYIRHSARLLSHSISLSIFYSLLYSPFSFLSHVVNIMTERIVSGGLGLMQTELNLQHIGMQRQVFVRLTCF